MIISTSTPIFEVLGLASEGLIQMVLGLVIYGLVS